MQELTRRTLDCHTVSAPSWQSAPQHRLLFTPAARVMDYIEQGKLSVAGVKFFVLDEADRLLDTGSQVLLETTFTQTQLDAQFCVNSRQSTA